MSDEEDVTAQLLRLATAPTDPAAEPTARIRAVVHREWLLARRRRMVRQRAAIILTAVAASVLIVLFVNRPRVMDGPRGRSVAIAQRIQGTPLLIARDQRAHARPLSVSTPIDVDDVIETDDGSRGAVETTDGSSVRIDRGSRVRFVEPAILEVLAGTAYISTAATSHGFEVRTKMGGLRDVGTQFEVRLLDSSLRVRVRVGAVEIRRNAGVTTAAAGTEAMVTATGITTRPVTPYGSEWTWTADIGPPFAIEGRGLRVFLDHLAAEEGWTVHYADREVAAAADRTILHGSVDGLKAEDALRVVLATSGLQYRLNAGELLVSKAADAR